MEGARLALVLSDRSLPYETLGRGVEEQLGAQVPSFSLSDGGSPKERLKQLKPDLVVAVGEEACGWVQREFPGTPLIACGVYAYQDPARFGRFPSVALDFSFDAYFKWIQEFLPGKRKIGVLLGTPRKTEVIESVVKAGGAWRFQILMEHLSKEKEVSAALQGLKQKGAEVFFVAPGSLFTQPEVFKYLIDFAVTQRIAVVAPSRALVKNGGLLSFEPNLVDLSRQAADLVRQSLARPVLPVGIQPPLEPEIGVNLKVAQSLKIEIPPSLLMKAAYIHR